MRPKWVKQDKRACFLLLPPTASGVSYGTLHLADNAKNVK